MEKFESYLKMTAYTKGGSNWFCDYHFYNGINCKIGTTKASGYGYDKHSTVFSNAINIFSVLYKFKNGIKWEDIEHCTTKDGSKIYGVYKDKSISYGIGLSSVLNCLKAFSNVKIEQIYYGKNENFIKLKITTTKKQLQKEIEKNNKIINNKKASKDNKRIAKNTNAKIMELFKIEE